MSETVIEPENDPILRVIDESTSTDDPWTSRQHIKQELRKTGSIGEYSQEMMNVLIQSKDVFYWHGLVAAKDPKILRAIIKQERDSTITRKILIGQANRALQEVSE